MALSETSALGKGCETGCAGGGIEVLSLPGTSCRERQYSAASPIAAPRGRAGRAQRTSAIYRGAPLRGTPKTAGPPEEKLLN